MYQDYAHWLFLEGRNKPTPLHICGFFSFPWLSLGTAKSLRFLQIVLGCGQLYEALSNLLTLNLVPQTFICFQNPESANTRAYCSDLQRKRGDHYAARMNSEEDRNGRTTGVLSILMHDAFDGLGINAGQSREATCLPTF